MARRYQPTPVRGRGYQYHFYDPQLLEWVPGKGKVPKLSLAMTNVKSYLDKCAEVPWETMKKKAFISSGTPMAGPLCRGNLLCWRRHRHPNIPHITQY